MSKPSFSHFAHSLFHRASIHQQPKRAPQGQPCRISYVSALALTLASCSSPQNQDSPELLAIDSQGAALTAVENTELSLKGIVSSADFLVESTSLAETWNSLEGSSASCEVTVGCAAGTQCPAETSTDCEADTVTQEDLQKVQDEAQEAVDKLVKFLREKVLIEANLDAAGTTDTQVTYKLGADVLCDTEGGSTANPAPGIPSSNTQPAPEPATTLDPECVEKANKASLRLRLTQPRPGDVDAAFVVGIDNYEPATLQLYHDRIGLKVDLAQALKAMRETGDAAADFEQLSGVLQLQLIKNAALNYSLQLSVLQALELKFKSGDDTASYSLAKSEPAIELNVDGNTKTINALYNYGALKLSAPLSSYASLFGSDEEPTAFDANGTPTPLPVKKTYTGIVEYLIPAITGKFSYTADSDVFHFSDVSLGNAASFLKWNGNPLATVNLNSAHGRGFSMDVSAKKTSTGGKKATEVKLDPTIDLDAKFNFQLIADQVAEIPDVLLDDTIRAWFEGQSPTFNLESNQIRMLSGSLHLTSQTHPEANVTVAEGQCAIANEETDVGAGISDAAPAPTPAASSIFEVHAATCE